MGSLNALDLEENILSLYILNRFHRLPGGQRLEDLYPEQIRFLMRAEAYHGDLERVIHHQGLLLRRELLESADPLELLPSRMAEAILSAGVDPAVEGESRRRIELGKVNRLIRGED